MGGGVSSTKAAYSSLKQKARLLVVRRPTEQRIDECPQRLLPSRIFFLARKSFEPFIFLAAFPTSLLMAMIDLDIMVRSWISTQKSELSVSGHCTPCHACQIHLEVHPWRACLLLESVSSELQHMALQHIELQSFQIRFRTQVRPKPEHFGVTEFWMRSVLFWVKICWSPSTFIVFLTQVEPNSDRFDLHSMRSWRQPSLQSKISGQAYPNFSLV